VVSQIFPPNNITNQYIDLVRLRPILSDSLPGEQLKMSCKFSIGKAKENGMFNVVSTCSYGGSLDATKISKTWIEKEKALKDAHTKEEIAFKKKDWLLLDAKRLVLVNSFDYIIETIGVYSNLKICEMACQIIVKKLQTLVNVIQTNKDIIKPADNTMPNCYDIRLDGEDYTIGKILEFVLYDKYFGKELTFCGFRKPHPHLDYSIIRLAFKTDVDNTEIITYLVSACSINIEIYDKMTKNFSRD
jgi:DNA-directed RNA polymerase subunit L